MENNKLNLETLEMKIINNKIFIDKVNNYSGDDLKDFYDNILKNIFNTASEITKNACEEYNQKLKTLLDKEISKKTKISEKELKIKTNELIKILNLDINFLINDINNVVLKIQNFYAGNRINYLQRIKIENEK